MALKSLIPFPIFAPPNQPHHHRPATEIRFSRWNNANAEKFIRHERTQKEIEDELRFHKRFNSADKIATNTHSSTTTNKTFKSTGTPSIPSRPSIPGKSSKYSKPPRNPKSPSHPAFRRVLKIRKLPDNESSKDTGVKVGEDGVSYLLPGAPFEYQYSYTETPKEKPIKLREPPIAPFGPSTMPRPWTGRKPLSPSKKELPEFDSFRLPPRDKKGVKPVQAPGPFVAGSGPKYVKSREEILGEPLTKEEIDDLVKGSMKSSRQLNMGRDGLTHNMLDNIHALWKRRRVCKIKCKGVCTVDMENVRQQLEEKTGGKIIRSKGGVLYLFRGRNYNYRTRPHFPLMLWKPVTPVYPRLIQRAPEGLTLEETSEMRKKGRELIPICKLGKNGVYCDLAKNVREAFEACELVRIDCQGMNGSDYRKIGAKLKDLVPCVLISFEREHILMWRGRNWKSSLPELEDDYDVLKKSEIVGAASKETTLKGLEVRSSSNILVHDGSPGNLNTSKDLSSKETEDLLSVTSQLPSVAAHAPSTVRSVKESENTSSYESCIGDNSEALTEFLGSTMSFEGTGYDERKGLTVGFETAREIVEQPGHFSVVPLTQNGLEDISENMSNPTEVVTSSSPWTQEVVLLWKQAVKGGSAVVLDDSVLDADDVYKRAAALAKSAPPGPVFKQRTKKAGSETSKKLETGASEVKEIVAVTRKSGNERSNWRNQKSNGRNQKKDPKADYLNVVPQGSLRIDELAKLLA